MLPGNSKFSMSLPPVPIIILDMLLYTWLLNKKLLEHVSKLVASLVLDCNLLT